MRRKAEGGGVNFGSRTRSLWPVFAIAATFVLALGVSACATIPEQDPWNGIAVGQHVSLAAQAYPHECKLQPNLSRTCLGRKAETTLDGAGSLPVGRLFEVEQRKKVFEWDIYLYWIKVKDMTSGSEYWTEDFQGLFTVSRQP